MANGKTSHAVAVGLSPEPDQLFCFTFLQNLDFYFAKNCKKRLQTFLQVNFEVNCLHKTSEKF